MKLVNPSAAQINDLFHREVMRHGPTVPVVNYSLEPGLVMKKLVALVGPSAGFKLETRDNAATGTLEFMVAIGPKPLRGRGETILLAVMAALLANEGVEVAS